MNPGETAAETADSDPDDGRDPAPTPVEPIRQFLNTLDIEKATDAWDTPEAAMKWLGAHDIYGECCAAITAPDLIRLKAFREAVRDLVDCAGSELPADSRAVLETEMARCPLVLTFCGETNQDVRLQPAGEQADAVIAWILAMIREAQLAGLWTRLHICRAEDCRWAFYDRSRNGSSQWCSMTTCGNRAKARRHRARVAEARA